MKFFTLRDFRRRYIFDLRITSRKTIHLTTEVLLDSHNKIRTSSPDLLTKYLQSILEFVVLAVHVRARSTSDFFFGSQAKYNYTVT